MSPTIFNLLLEGIVWKRNLIFKNVITNQIQLIAYVDNIKIIANWKANKSLDKEARKLVLEINESKTKKGTHRYTTNHTKSQIWIKKQETKQKDKDTEVW